MKKNWLILIAGIALLLVAAVLMVNSANNPTPARVTQTTSSQTAGDKPRACDREQLQRLYLRTLKWLRPSRVLHQRSIPTHSPASLAMLIVQLERYR